MNVTIFARRAAVTLCSRHIDRCAVQTRFVSTIQKTDHRQTREPLKVLFCGSDDFSIASLRALVELQRKQNSPIKTIEVLCRPDKRVGTGLKKINEVPIKKAARELRLPVQQIDDFKDFYSEQLSSKVNLIIAVSFGLLIPAHVIAAVKYGGLNVHPSLLPDLRGAAPIHYALLNRRSHTGVTVQTLHPTKFDHGQIVAQSALPGIAIPASATVDDLLPILAKEGADLLTTVIESGAYVDPTPPQPPSQEQVLAMSDGRGLAKAPRFDKSDMRLDWKTMSAETILRRHRVFGRLWDDTLSPTVSMFGNPKPVRIIYDELREATHDAGASTANKEWPPRFGYYDKNLDGQLCLCVNTVDGGLIEVVTCTIANKKTGRGKAEILRNDRIAQEWEATASSSVQPGSLV